MGELLKRAWRQADGRRAAVLGFAVLVLAGCEGTSLLKDGASLLKTESLTAAITPANVATNLSSVHPEGTQEIYLRVARGAKACWFGTGKPLDKTHAFEGKLAPESEGGAAEIAVHIRSPDQPSPRAGKVFIVAMTKEGAGTSLVTENRRLPEGLANAMRADVARWAKTGSVECSDLEVAENPISTASIAPALPERKPAVKKAKAKK